MFLCYGVSHHSIFISSQVLRIHFVVESQSLYLGEKVVDYDSEQ